MAAEHWQDAYQRSGGGQKTSATAAAVVQQQQADEDQARACCAVHILPERNVAAVLVALSARSSPIVLHHGACTMAIPQYPQGAHSCIRGLALKHIEEC